jgi:Uma2 family endonuclease
VTVTYDDSHICQTLGGREFRTSLGGSITSRALGGAVMELGAVDENGWWFLPRVAVRINDDIIVPDLSGWRRERMPVLPDDAFIDLAPDWVLEVVTPETAALVRMNKLSAYWRSGVEYVWLVDPRIHVIEVFRRADSGWAVLPGHGGEEPARLAPFEGREIVTRRLWLP